MSGTTCADMQLLIQADHDGELDAEGAARVAAHVRDCCECAAQAAGLRRLSARLRAEIPAEALPPRLHSMAARMSTPPRAKLWRLAGRQYPGFVAGLALAACLALAVLPRRGADIAGEAVAAHIRALQPGHAVDVVSTDRHTVKPWFDGKLDFAPPVRDFAAAGFPLQGGRLDYVGGRPVAGLVYGRARHMIDVLVWPAPPATSREGEVNGYKYRSWSQGGMQFWAVSDLNPAELRSFTDLWR